MGWRRLLGPLVLVIGLAVSSCAAPPFSVDDRSSAAPDDGLFPAASRAASDGTADLGTAIAAPSGTSPSGAPAGPTDPAAKPATTEPVTSSSTTATTALGEPDTSTATAPADAAVATDGGAADDAAHAGEDAAPPPPSTEAPAAQTAGPTASTEAPAPAPADADADPVTVGAEALARIAFPVSSALAGWTIDFLPGRAGLLGGTYTRQHRIEIYVRTGQAVDEVAFTLAHEIGHAVDLTYLTNAERQTWKVARGIDSSVAWWAGSGVSDYASGSGDWAEAFAVWQVGGTGLSQLAGQPTGGQLDLMAALSAS